MTPAADASAPACWIGQAGFLIDLGSLLANGLGGSTVALVGRDEFDAALTVPVVVPVDKGRYPLARLRFAGKWPIGVLGPVFDRSEQGFRVGVVVADARPRERSQHSQCLQPALQRGALMALPISAWRISGGWWYWWLPKPLGRR